MRELIILLVLLIVMLLAACGAQPQRPTIRGADLYARVGELKAAGHAAVPSNQQPVTVRMDQYLVDRSRDQIFVVEQAVAGCDGIDIAADDDCTLALIGDQRFTVVDAPPEPKRVQRDEDDEDISPLNKARIALALAGTAMVVGAAKCEFEGCTELLGVAAGLDGLLLLLLFTGMH